MDPGSCGFRIVWIQDHVGLRSCRSRIMWVQDHVDPQTTHHVGDGLRDTCTPFRMTGNITSG